MPVTKISYQTFIFLSVFVYKQRRCHKLMCTSSLQTPSPQSSGADDFLDTLLHDSSSVPGSPLWSPCTAHNGVNEDTLAKLTDCPHAISCTGFPAFDIRVFSQAPDMENSPAAKEKLPDVSIDLGKDTKVETFAETDQNRISPLQGELIFVLRKQIEQQGFASNGQRNENIVRYYFSSCLSLLWCNEDY